MVLIIILYINCSITGISSEEDEHIPRGLKHNWMLMLMISNLLLLDAKRGCDTKNWDCKWIK